MIINQEKLNTELFFDSKYGQWGESLDAMKEGQIVEMSEDTYWHFLGCVPPRLQASGGFVCGEPYTHNNEGEAIYLCAKEIDSKYYAAYGTMNEFKNGLFSN